MTGWAPSPAPSWAIGIDVGGTFTDIVLTAPDGALVVAKAATTPRDQSDGVMDALRLAADAAGLGVPELLAATSRIVHGTTAATNALLERKTARVGMLTTEGHRDVVDMREGLKPDRYNLRMPAPVPLVPRHLRLPVRERMRADGTVAVALDMATVDEALARLEAAGVQSVAVCLLHAWRNPAHEQAVAQAARRRMPDAFVTTSSEVLPAIKEFERFSTTVANALVGPIIDVYLGRLQARLRGAGLPGGLLILMSHGGVATAEEAGRLAIGTALSGPAGGVAAALALVRRGAGERAGEGVGDALITFDMGGTSTDIALIRGGQATLSAGRAVGEARIALPMLDIVTLGAGGGSIARVDRAGLLQVGPQSAGAVPGPACYGHGGTRPTVTDANLCLGYLGLSLGGRTPLDLEAAQCAIDGLAGQLGLTRDAAAAGIHRVVNARMADGVRVTTVRRGVDPRQHALLAFGGAASLHVCAVAAELGVTRVIVPVQASVFSAWGMLNTDLRVELTRSVGGGSRPLLEVFRAMEAEGRERLRWFDGPIELRCSADMRYGEQVFEIPVPLDRALLEDGAGLDPATLAKLFHRRHEALFTYALRDQEVVLVNARMSVVGRLPPTGSRPAPHRTVAPGVRCIHLGGWIDVPVHAFDALGPEAIEGPCLVESATTTILLRQGDRGRIDPRGWLGIDVSA